MFYHSALQEWLSSERLVSRMKVRVCVHEGYGVCGEKMTFEPVCSEETQASQIIHLSIQGLWSLPVYKTKWKNILFLLFLCLFFFHTMCLDHLSLSAGIRGILMSFFMSDVWPLQWKSLSGTQVGKSYILHYNQYGWLQQNPFWGLEKPVIESSVI